MQYYSRGIFGGILGILGDRVAVISGYAQRKVLRSLNAAGGGFNRQAGNRDRRTGTSRIGVQHLTVEN